MPNLPDSWRPPELIPARPRWLAFALSMLVHGIAIGAILGLDILLQSDDFRMPAYQVQMLPKENPQQQKVLWYDSRPPVPEVAPTQPFGPAKIPQGQKDPSGRILIANSPKPASQKQFIQRPDHPEPLPADTPAPNLAVQAVAPPIPKAPLKSFTPPSPSAPQPNPAPVPLAEPPHVTPKLVGTLGNDPLGRGLLPQQLASVPRPAPKVFVPPSPAVVPTGPQPLFEAPPTSAPIIRGEPGGKGSALSAIVVGLDPAPGPIPEGSRTAQFSRAPNAGPASSGTPAQPGAATAPGLLAHNAPGRSSENASGRPPEAAAPSSEGTIPKRILVKEISFPALNRTLSAPLRPSSRVIPASIEARFAGRDVYTMVIPAPDLPEYSGDWVLWFSERHTHDEGASRISAPIPARKYSWTGTTAIPPDSPENGTVQLAAVVDPNGRVSSARILRGGTAGEAFRLRATEELQTWEFHPAMRNGEPIDVDIVVEIPFRFHTIH